MDRNAPSRRTVLKSAAAGAVGSTFAPALLGAEDKSGSKNPILGSGEYRYEAFHNWGTLPDHLKWGNTHGVCFDKDGLIYITHQSDAKEPMDAIVVFDPKGKYARSFGKDYHGGGHGLDIRRDGSEEFLYLCDIKNRRVVKLTLKGEKVWQIEQPAEPGVYTGDAKYVPTNVAFAPDGGFYIGDGYGSSYVHQYDKDAKWVRTFGGPGDDKGKLKQPHGLWIDDRPGRKPSLVVADRANNRLQYFTLDGEHVGFAGNVLFPCHFDIRGDVLLIPDLHARVTLLGKDNKPLVQLGDDKTWIEEVKKMKVRGEPDRYRPGLWVHPHDAAFDRDGNIFVVEWVPVGRVTKLVRLA